MRIGLTGAAGYIGSVLHPFLLEKGYDVVALDNFYYNQQHRIDVIYVDMTTDTWRIYLNDCDIIINLAALVGEKICIQKPQKAWKINFDVVRALTDSKIRIIMPNTNSFYGSQSGICTEESLLKPLSIYAQSKLAGENYLLTNPNNCSLRLATVYGVSPRFRRDLLVNDFTIRLLEEEELQVSEGQFCRNFISIQDVCEAFLFAIKNNLSGIYNVGNDSENTTKIDLAETIEHELQQIGELSLLKNHIIQNNCYIDPDKRNYQVSSQKIYNLGFKCQHNIQEAVKKIAQMYNSRQLNPRNNKYEITSNAYR